MEQAQIEAIAAKHDMPLEKVISRAADLEAAPADAVFQAHNLTGSLIERLQSAQAVLASLPFELANGNRNILTECLKELDTKVYAHIMEPWGSFFLHDPEDPDSDFGFTRKDGVGEDDFEAVLKYLGSLIHHSYQVVLIFSMKADLLDTPDWPGFAAEVRMLLQHKVKFLRYEQDLLAAIIAQHPVH